MTIHKAQIKMVRFFFRISEKLKTSLLLFLMLPGLIQVVEAVDSTEENDHEVGLVLSGGGAKGFAHIGVLKVLEEVDMPIDYITGSSMGSVMGGLRAIGYDAEALEEIALETNWVRLFEDESLRRHMPLEEKIWDGMFLGTLPIREGGMSLPGGIVEGHKIVILLSRLTWPYHHVEDFSELPIPFAAMATDVETGESVVLNSGYLPEAIRASIAIPGVFQPMLIDGRYLVDGGLVHNLPVDEVQRMGADFSLSVNVSTQLQSREELRSLFSILEQTISIAMLENMREQEAISDYLLSPDLSGFTLRDFDEAGEIIALGEAHAREHYDALEQLADSLRELRQEPEKITEPAKVEPVRIDSIKIRGLRNFDENLFREQIGVRKGMSILPQDVEEGIDRLYSMPFFERITYRLKRNEDHNLLIFNVEEITHDEFNFGFRYDAQRQASLLFNVALRDLVTQSSTSRLSLRLGEEIEVDGRYFNYPSWHGFITRIGVQTRLNYTRYPIDIFENHRRMSSVTTDAFFGEVMTGPLIGNLAMASGGFRASYFHQQSTIGEFEFPEDWSLYFSVFGDLWMDSLNRRYFPERGQSLEIRTDFSLPNIANTLAFSRHEIDWEGYYPLAENWTAGHQIRLAQAFGADLPLHYRFRSSHYPDAPGFRLHELSGFSYASGQALLRFEPWPDRFLTARMGVTNAFDDLLEVIEGAPLYAGWALEAGMRIFGSPAQVAFTGSRENPLLFEVQIGFDL